MTLLTSATSGTGSATGLRRRRRRFLIVLAIGSGAGAATGCRRARRFRLGMYERLTNCRSHCQPVDYDVVLGSFRLVSRRNETFKRIRKLGKSGSAIGKISRPDP